MHRRIREGTLELCQLEVQRNPLSNHKGKGVAAVVISADLGEDEEERSALPATTITTLQRSSRANKQRIFMEALVSIASGAGVECLAVETRVDKTFLQDTNEITFSNENMKVGYSDHRRRLYLVASINQIPIKRSLVDSSTLVNLIPLSTLQVAGISVSKIQECPIEVTGFEGYCRPHTTMAEGGSNGLLDSFSYGKD